MSSWPKVEGLNLRNLTVIFYPANFNDTHFSISGKMMLHKTFFHSNYGINVSQIKFFLPLIF